MHDAAKSRPVSIGVLEIPKRPKMVFITSVFLLSCMRQNATHYPGPTVSAANTPNELMSLHALGTLYKHRLLAVLPSHCYS